jgi:hypothetical protein
MHQIQVRTPQLDDFQDHLSQVEIAEIADKASDPLSYGIGSRDISPRE